MITVAIPLYNKENHIANTLHCVLAQTFADYEIVIVNDGSTDNSAAEVTKFDDPRIRLVNQQNMGVSAARNRAVAEARGEYVAFLDADDEWHTDYLATQYALATKYPECDVFAVNYEFKSATGNVSTTIINGVHFSGDDGVLDNYFEVASSSHPPICSISVMVRRSAIEAIGGFPVGIPRGEDLLTWARLAARYKIAYCREAKATYVLSDTHGVNAKPVNIPRGNAVGSRLEALLEDYKGDRRQLKSYIGRWYKIRANIFLRGGEKRNAMINILRTIKYKPLEWKIYIYFALWFLPTNAVNRIFKNMGGREEL